MIASLLLTAVGTTWLWIGERTRRQRNSQAIAAIYQGVLELAAGAGKGGTRAWDLARDQVEILERDPDLVELAADARLRLARRAEAEGADRRAEIAWQHAIEAAEVSLRAHPGQPARMEDLAEALAKLGMIRVRAGQDFQANAQSLFDRSIRHGAEARQIRKLRLETHPTEIDARLDLAESIVRSSVHQTSLIAPADLDAVEWVVLDWSRGWMSCTPEQKRRLAGINLTLTAWQRAIGQSGPAERSALMALRLLKEPSASRLDKFILARAHLARGLALADFHESQAILVLEEAARRLDGFALEDPDAAEELRLLGQAVFEVGRLRMREGSREKGVASYRRSLAVRITLDRRFPGAHAHAAELAQTRAALARGLEGRPWESLRHSFQAFTDQARAVGLAPGEPRHREDLGRFTQALVSDLWVVLTRARLAASPESPPLEKISPSTRQPVAGSP